VEGLRTTPFLGWLLFRLRSGWIPTRDVARIIGEEPHSHFNYEWDSLKEVVGKEIRKRDFPDSVIGGFDLESGRAASRSRNGQGSPTKLPENLLI
jgi:hypothetical protein